MIQIAPQGYNKGAALGEALGTGLGEGFKVLADQKMKQIQQRNLVKGLEGLGYDQQKAEQLSGLPQDLLKEAIKIPVQQKKLEHEQYKAAEKESSEYFKKIALANNTADESNKRISRMKVLINRGKLPNATYYKIFKGLEEDHGHLSFITKPIGKLLGGIQRNLSPDAEEFEKLSNEFIKGAKAVFGNRITDNDLKAYMAQIPTLGNSDEGKKAIIRNMELANEAERLKYETAKQIIKQNGGRRPANLEFLVEEAVGDQLQELADTFIENPDVLLKRALAK